MAPTQITCAFCGVLNNAADNNCMACGAPLEISKPAPVTVTVVPDSLDISAAETFSTATPGEPLKQQFSEGISAVGAGLGLAGVGGLLLRTVAEALAILIAAIVIGFNAGRVSPFPNGFPFLLLGVGGSALVGLAVGSVVKRAVFVLFSAPFGALLGVGAATLLKLNVARTPWLPLFAIAGACLLALLGGRSNRTARFAGYQRFRPLLGAIGGILFGLIGFSAGWIVH